MGRGVLAKPSGCVLPEPTWSLGKIALKKNRCTLFHGHASPFERCSTNISRLTHPTSPHLLATKKTRFSIAFLITKSFIKVKPQQATNTVFGDAEMHMGTEATHARGRTQRLPKRIGFDAPFFAPRTAI